MITERNDYKTGRLSVRPGEATAKQHAPGVHNVKLDNKRQSFIYVPSSYDPQKPCPLVVLLHGAGGQAGHGLSILRGYADANNLLLLAPSSQAGTWDIIANEAFGTDVRYMDEVMQHCFQQYSIDSTRCAIGGFSDGASYALCIGLTNGDLFTHVLAFSPGFVYKTVQVGTPGVFISHGTKDRILPIDVCSRRIVSQLKEDHLKINYKEFEGGHEIPARISRSAVDWFLKPGPIVRSNEVQRG